MSKEKQIEEMSNDLRLCHTEFSTGDEEIYTDYDATAQKLIAKGWSRQSEWISVDERLPEVAQKVLLFSPSDGVNLGYVTDDKRFYVYKSYPERPTHWMPLPEAPKGGEE